MRAKAWMKTAERAAMTTSQASARLAPAPAAAPLTAAMVGIGQSVDGAEHRLVLVAEGGREVEVVVDLGGVEVLAGAEAAAGAGEDEDAGRGGRGGDGGEDVAAHGGVQAVHAPAGG